MTKYSRTLAVVASVATLTAGPALAAGAVVPGSGPTGGGGAVVTDCGALTGGAVPGVAVRPPANAHAPAVTLRGDSACIAWLTGGF